MKKNVGTEKTSEQLLQNAKRSVRCYRRELVLRLV